LTFCTNRASNHILIMRQMTIGFSLIALILFLAEPALAGRQGVPGRRVGGGTRWSAPHSNLKSTLALQEKLGTLALSPRDKLPLSQYVKAIYG
jgi:hypothetical protein